MTFTIRHGGAAVPLGTKALYSPPKLRQLEAATFLTPAWDAPVEDSSFRSLRPFYLVCRKPKFSVSAVRFKFEGEQAYRDWQAVAVVHSPVLERSGELISNDIGLLDTGVHAWLLLGFVSVGVHFDVELRCCDAYGKVAIAGCHSLIALESRSFELAQL